MRIGAPLMIAYIAELAMFLITRMVVGDLGYESLAGGHIRRLTFELRWSPWAQCLSSEFCWPKRWRYDDRSVGSAQSRNVGRDDLGLASTAVWSIPSASYSPRARGCGIGYTVPLPSGCTPTLWFTALRSCALQWKMRSIMLITIGAVGVQWFFTEGLATANSGSRLGSPVRAGL